MTRTRDPWDMFADDLDSLPGYDASPERVERIRARCLAALAARRCATLRLPVRRAAWREWLAPAFALGLSACHLAAAIGTALRLAEVMRTASPLLR
jgi:hypothetical protein